MGNALENELAAMLNTSLNGKVWTPSRSSGLFGQALLQLEHKIQRLNRRGPKKIDTSSGAAVVTAGGIPKQVVSCSGTESPASQVDRVYSQVAISFTRDPTDANFAGVHIWLTGYHGNNQPVLITDAADSPAVFLVETTGENVTVTVQPFNASHVAAPFAGAKTCVVPLDGAVSAPPAPSINTPTATITSGAVTVGQQFSFNYLPASLTDVIDGYWIYRTSVHSLPGIASRWKFVKAAVLQSGIYTLVDSSGVSTNFYYVSSVNKQGLESSLTDATPSGGGGGGTTTYRPSTNTAIAGGGFQNPANAYDGNATTYAFGTALNNATVTSSWQGFSAAVGTPTAIKLKITSLASFPTGATGTVTLAYSINGGVSYTNVYSVSSSRAQITDVITLANAQDLTQVRVKMSVNGTAVTKSTTCNLYEAWIEVTT